MISHECAAAQAIIHNNKRNSRRASCVADTNKRHTHDTASRDTHTHTKTLAHNSTKSPETLGSITKCFGVIPATEIPNWRTFETQTFDVQCVRACVCCEVCGSFQFGCVSNNLRLTRSFNHTASRIWIITSSLLARFVPGYTQHAGLQLWWCRQRTKQDAACDGNASY